MEKYQDSSRKELSAILIEGAHSNGGFMTSTPQVYRPPDQSAPPGAAEQKDKLLQLKVRQRSRAICRARNALVNKSNSNNYIGLYSFLGRTCVFISSKSRGRRQSWPAKVDGRKRLLPLRSLRRIICIQPNSFRSCSLSLENEGDAWRQWLQPII